MKEQCPHWGWSHLGWVGKAGRPSEGGAAKGDQEAGNSIWGQQEASVQSECISICTPPRESSEIEGDLEPSCVQDGLEAHGLEAPRIPCPWDFSGKNTGVGCYFHLWGIFLTQGSNLYLLLGIQVLYYWATWHLYFKRKSGLGGQGT